MSNMSELKQHLHAIQQTKQITNAMYLLSTSRMKKSMQKIDYNLLYLRRLRATMKDILSKTKRSDIHNRFIEQQTEGRSLFIIITADKGLCGGYNSNIINLAMKRMAEHDNPIVCSLGTVGSEMLRSRKIIPDYSWYDALQHPSLYMARLVAEKLTSLYIEHSANEVYVVYTEYVSSSVQTPTCRRLLPLLRRDFLDIKYEYTYMAEPIYEPTVEAVFDEMVPQYITGFMYDVFMQAATSENSARMTAMQNATKNADEMITDLTAEINAARQLAITNEITEIAAASELAGSV